VAQSIFHAIYRSIVMRNAVMIEPRHDQRYPWNQCGRRVCFALLAHCAHAKLAASLEDDRKHGRMEVKVA
jgi:hypothetical protein